MSAAVVGLLAAGLVAWSFVANLGLGERGYLVRNLVATAVLLVLGRVLGLPADALGLAPSRVPAGAAWGLAAAAVVAAALSAAVALAPRIAGVATLLEDHRAALPRRAVVRHTLLRIPFGTALFEEVAFRGVLLAAMVAVTSDLAAVAWSSLAFGLWHIAPTMVTLRINDVAVGTPRGVGAIAGAVAVTAVAGAGFAALRVGSGSLLAPVLAHWATNAGGMIAARWHRSRRDT